MLLYVFCVQEVSGESAGAVAADALQQEREEQRRLLADSHSLALELRWKLQHGEKRWTRERNDLLEQFEKERQEWDHSLGVMHRKMEKVRGQRSSDCTVVGNICEILLRKNICDTKVMLVVKQS